MHATLHLISKRNNLTMDDIDEILEPFYEGNVFKYDEEIDEYTKPDIYPQFHQDYFRTFDRVIWEKPEDCFVIVDPDGYAITRKWWNGKEHIDQTEQFELFVKNNRAKWSGCYMYELDIHW